MYILATQKNGYPGYATYCNLTKHAASAQRSIGHNFDWVISKCSGVNLPSVCKQQCLCHASKPEPIRINYFLMMTNYDLLKISPTCSMKSEGQM